jgi:hypothetical protein
MMKGGPLGTYSHNRQQAKLNRKGGDAAFFVKIKRVECGANMAGYKYSQRKMRRDGLSEDAAGLPGESPPPLANIDIYSRCAYSRFRISFRPGQAESGHHLGWEWLSPHASFDESTPVASDQWLVNHRTVAPHQMPLRWGNTAHD